VSLQPDSQGPFVTTSQSLSYQTNSTAYGASLALRLLYEHPGEAETQDLGAVAQSLLLSVIGTIFYDAPMPRA
jgi:hypothetical protein